jgi:serpin B
MIAQRPVRVLTAVVAVAAMALTACTSSSKKSPPGPSGQFSTASRIDGAIQLVANTAPLATVDQHAVDQVVAAEQKLTLAMLTQLDTGRNVSVSATSLYLALGMLQNAARGQTEQQIAKALQAAGLSTADQNAGLAGLVQDLTAAAAKDRITLASANSLWQQRGFAIRQQFLNTLAKYYRTGVWQVDYQRDNAGAVKAINDWTSQQTAGKIPKLFDRLDPTTVLVLANAIYFHAAWATPFDTAETTDGTFTAGDGTQVPVKFMSGGPGLVAGVTKDYQAVQLPYTGGRFAALAIMPTSGTLGDFVRALTPEKINSIAAGLKSGYDVTMPRFTTTSTINLVPVLKALGMVVPFDDRADLSGLSSEPTQVDQVVQRVYLGVGEKGTTAAAVTGIAVGATAAEPGPQVVLNHPFLFLVRDTTTGTILFASEVQNPAAG